jgi:predicted ABC-type ATPase
LLIKGKFSPELFTENATKPVVKMIELKLSQGAKPAHGGVLPKAKITPAIAKARGVGNIVTIFVFVFIKGTYRSFT